MSTAATRAAVAAAASSVTGVNVTAYRRQNLAPLQGFVHFTRRARSGNRIGWVDTWQVWVALPTDVEAAEKWADDHLPELLDALRAELVITSAFPAELLPGTGAPTVPGLVIEGAREG